MRYMANENESYILTVQVLLDSWKECGDKLDAYILPQPSGYHSIGIRYGNDGHEYLSPPADKEKAQALLNELSYTEP